MLFLRSLIFFFTLYALPFLISLSFRRHLFCRLSHTRRPYGKRIDAFSDFVILLPRILKNNYVSLTARRVIAFCVTRLNDVSVDIEPGGS